MDASKFSLSPTEPANANLPQRLKVILAYENLSSALWAAETFKSLLRQSSDGPETQLFPWSFSTLSNPDFQAQATDAGSQADLIVIAATSSFRLLPEFVESWLGKCLRLRRSANTVVAALFGGANLPDRADSLRLRTVQRLALDAGCKFFVPAGVGAA